MKLRPLVIDDEARAKIARVLAYAKDHHYRKGQPPPGDNPEFVTFLNSFRCVFTYTNADGMLWRHLSISVPNPATTSDKKYPNQLVAFTIAQLFGFDGWDGSTVDRLPDTWWATLDTAQGCVVFAQPIKSTATVCH